MEIQTSTQAYELYCKLSDREDRVRKQNGRSLFSPKEEKNFYIKVRKEVSLNLLGIEQEIVVNTNIDLVNWNWKYNLKEFLINLEKVMKKPYYKFFVQNNRRQENKVDISWEAKLRKQDFNFEDIEIIIGEEAKKELAKLKIDFCEKVKRIIENKVIVTDEDISYFEKYSYLTSRKEDLKRQRKESRNGYYSYGEPKDDTLKICISDEEYNLKLKEVEIEMNKICKKYPYLNKQRFDYVEIKEPLVYEKWKKENEDELRENWDEMNDEDKEDYYGDFDQYAESCFEYACEED